MFYYWFARQLLHCIDNMAQRDGRKYFGYIRHLNPRLSEIDLFHCWVCNAFLYYTALSTERVVK